jgi:hypothetical protein
MVVPGCVKERLRSVDHSGGIRETWYRLAKHPRMGTKRPVASRRAIKSLVSAAWAALLLESLRGA